MLQPHLREHTDLIILHIVQTMADDTRATQLTPSSTDMILTNTSRCLHGEVLNEAIYIIYIHLYISLSSVLRGYLTQCYHHFLCWKIPNFAGTRSTTTFPPSVRGRKSKLHATCHYKTVNTAMNFLQLACIWWSLLLFWNEIVHRYVNTNV